MMPEIEVTYHAVLMDRDCELVAEIDLPVNFRYLVIVPTPVGPALMAGDDAPSMDELPDGSMPFHRLGSAVYTSAVEADALFELVDL